MAYINWNYEDWVTKAQIGLLFFEVLVSCEVIYINAAHMGSNTAEIDGLVSRAWQARRDGQLDEAQSLLLKAADLCRTDVLLKPDRVNILRKLAHVLQDKGETDAALKALTEANDLCAQIEDDYLTAHTLSHLGDVYRAKGLLEEADPVYAEALSYYQNADEVSELDLANALRSMALLREQQNDTAQAIKYWRQAHYYYQATHIQPGVDECNEKIAALQQ